MPNLKLPLFIVIVLISIVVLVNTQTDLNIQNSRHTQNIAQTNLHLDDGICLGCHGNRWEKSALGSSHIVSQMSYDAILNALMGYKYDLYGRDKKALMMAQVQKYSDEEIIALSKRVAKNIGATIRSDEINIDACIGCHGSSWNRLALSSSKDVSTMTQNEIFQALKGYKSGTYGGEKREIMKAQLQHYSEDELLKISKMITN